MAHMRGDVNIRSLALERSVSDGQNKTELTSSNATNVSDRRNKTELKSSNAKNVSIRARTCQESTLAVQELLTGESGESSDVIEISNGDQRLSVPEDLHYT